MSEFNPLLEIFTLSTVDAEKLLLEQDMSRKKRKKIMDALAASIILQRYFENDDLVNI